MRVECQHSLQKVQGLSSVQVKTLVIIRREPALRVSVGVQLVPRNLWFVGKRLQVAPGLLVDDAVEIIRAR